MTAGITIEQIVSQVNDVAKTLEQLSADFIGSHDSLSQRAGEQGQTLELTHNKIELIESRLATDSKNIAMLAQDIENMQAEPPKPDKSAIYAALAAAQVEIVNATTNVDNAFTKKKYADLASVMDAVRGPLSKNGIALFQLTEDVSISVLGIRTVLAHESGQTIEDVITMSPPKNDPQGIGSCRTYMRRYAVIAMCGIAGALDDDAEGTKEDPNDYPRISVSEVEKIIYTADELLGDRADEVVKRMLDGIFGGIQVVGDIREGEAEAALQAIQNAKNLIDKKAAAADKTEKAAKKKAAEEK